jgi:hypothetical protein
LSQYQGQAATPSENFPFLGNSMNKECGEDLVPSCRLGRLST